MPKRTEGTIALDQSAPKVGDTVTFTVTGLKRGYVTVAVYGDGERWATRVGIGDPVTLQLAGLGYAWLDDDANLSDGFSAACSFNVE